MTIQLINKAEFLHIPKTGGSWVKSVLKENNLILKEFGHEHADYDRNLLKGGLSRREHLEEVISSTKKNLQLKMRPSPLNKQIFRFCFVRNPISWYESWWKYMNERNWNNWGECNSKHNWHPNSILNGLGSTDFNQFVTNVIKKRPGYVTELLFSYTKSGISFIGKTENIRNDLMTILDIINLPYDIESITKSPKVNKSQTDKNDTVIHWDPKLKEIVKRLELPSLLHFNYLSEQEKNDLGINIDIQFKNIALNTTRFPPLV